MYPNLIRNDQLSVAAFRRLLKTELFSRLFFSTLVTAVNKVGEHNFFYYYYYYYYYYYHLLSGQDSCRSRPLSASGAQWSRPMLKCKM